MKNIKRFMSIITAAVMVFCLNAFTVSAETFSITVNNTNTDSVSINGKTFTAYKVFSVKEPTLIHIRQTQPVSALIIFQCCPISEHQT